MVVPYQKENMNILNLFIGRAKGSGNKGGGGAKKGWGGNKKGWGGTKKGKGGGGNWDWRGRHIDSDAGVSIMRL